ncbi:cytochrome d ubiquinol oxidase subunit I [Halorubrum distributum JCM 9100]|uniref:Cytochrome d ubiquinol oxidase subunit I n=2 Tax=Halorubrum distributum TaxID=29283 RepID=M0EXM7_9EURY|nr:cytochrome ubiquinol oxidase subunit I [Halorubrum distributum]ELZ52465.1 cytochrome d ubiquinol oxidase subunit I [Halorubrum distributum JCM 9100]ELZ58492.1 cytochrome d ubiquinol oxidase subunit I [Halorubrum distributum JCM 10118]
MFSTVLPDILIQGWALQLSPELASRAQFGWTISVHIIFASLSVGLAPFIVYFTWKDVRTDDERFTRLRSFWVKVFAAGFVMGTVTGIPMSFQFGTNFPQFAEVAGELIGGPLAFEAKMAFFLEAVFLGVLLFGQERVSDRTYIISSVLVGVGAWLSAFWILIVNAWMQTPQGFEMITRNGMEVAKLTDPLAAFFTPRMPWMYVHMVNASVISVALLVAGVSAYIVWKKRDAAAWNTALKLAVIILLVTAPLQAVHGDAYGRHVADTQPQKFAAMEAHYETGTADLHLLAFPKSIDAITDPKAENLFTVSLPGVGSFLASGGDFDAEVLGLNEYEENPPVAMVFWSFRFMVGLGFLFIGLALWGGYLIYNGRLSERDRFLKTMIAASPLGYAALLTGWYVTEIGRQPWVIQGELRTSEAVSSTLSGTEATLTLVGFVVIYIGLILVALHVLRWLVEDELRELGVKVSDDDRWYGPVPKVSDDD